MRFMQLIGTGFWQDINLAADSLRLHELFDAGVPCSWK